MEEVSAFREAIIIPEFKEVLRRLMLGCNMALFFIMISTYVQVAQAAPVSCDKRQAFVVLSIENKTSDPEWQNHLIALGLKNLIHEELFATGCYVPAETDSEVQSMIDELVMKSWRGQSASSDAEVLGARGPAVDTTVKVIIKSFSREHSRLRIGPFSSGGATIKVVLEILLSKSGGDTKRAEGTGEGVTKAQGVLFQIRADKVYFDESTVGIAVHEAIRAAVNRLMDR